MYLPVFSTDCATYASHLEITSVGGESYGQESMQDGYSDAVTQGHTPPLSSRGSWKPIDEYPYCTEGCRGTVAHAYMYISFLVGTFPSKHACEI